MTSPWVRDSESRETVAGLARQFTIEHVLEMERRVKKTVEAMRGFADLNVALTPDETRLIADLLEGKK